MQKMRINKSSALNFGKKGTSITNKIGNTKITTGHKGTTTTTTVKIGSGFSITTQTRNGKTRTRINKPRPRFL